MAYGEYLIVCLAESINRLALLEDLSMSIERSTTATSEGQHRGVAWAMAYLILLLLLLLASGLFAGIVNQTVEYYLPRVLAAAYLPTIMGGLGGILRGFWQRSRAESNPYPLRGYILLPLMGTALGALLYLLLVSLADTYLRAMQADTSADLTQGPLGSLLLAVYLIAGFGQNAIWTFLDRFPSPWNAESQ